jgi:hypothetical protein
VLFARCGRYESEDFTQLGWVGSCHDSGVGRVVWSVREGRIGQFDAPEILGGYRSANPVHEPRLGDVLRLPDGSGPWRVIDWTLADRVDAAGNVLVVQPVSDQAA